MQLCVLYWPQNKQRLFPCAKFTGFYNRDDVCVYCAVRTEASILITVCAHAAVVCFVLTQNKQRLFPYTELTGFYNQDGVCLLRGTD